MNTLEQISIILSDHGGLESNIPWGHCYWDLLTKLRAGVLDTYECSFDVQPLNAPKAPPSGTPGQIQARLSATRNQLRTILNSFGRQESNIPFTNDYWFLQNVAKSLERELAALA